MPDRVFVDTNILIYAHDLDAGTKSRRASEVLSRLWEENTGALSTQVLQEFYVNVTQKIPDTLTPAVARSVIEDYLVWHIDVVTPKSVLAASEIAERYQLSFWDAMIVTSAINVQATKLVTEDLNHGQVIRGILIENPLLDGH